jgi:23S rRNA (adenine-N6)-dimethyltransferase
VVGDRRAWGWHRLDHRWAEQLVADAAVEPGALVLDIGAGDGALTRPLLDAGARVIAVEWHPDRVLELRRRFGDRVRVVAADAGDLRLPRRPFSVVSSVPYAATTPIVQRLLHNGSRLTAAHLVLQAQAARRWHSADAPGRGRWGFAFTTELGRPVPRRAFTPPPHVDSRVLVIGRRL